MRWDGSDDIIISYVERERLDASLSRIRTDWCSCSSSSNTRRRKEVRSIDRPTTSASLRLAFTFPFIFFFVLLLSGPASLKKGGLGGDEGRDSFHKQPFRSLSSRAITYLYKYPVEAVGNDVYTHSSIKCNPTSSWWWNMQGTCTPTRSPLISCYTLMTGHCTGTAAVATLLLFLLIGFVCFVCFLYVSECLWTKRQKHHQSWCTNQITSSSLREKQCDHQVPPRFPNIDKERAKFLHLEHRPTPTEAIRNQQTLSTDWTTDVYIYFLSYFFFFPYYFFFMLVSYSSHSAPLSDLQFDLHTIFNLFLSISATARAPCGVHQLFFIQNRFFFPL